MEHIPFQVKQNASEYNDFLKDLGQWEKDMKEKENRRGPKSNVISNPSLPLPRNKQQQQQQQQKTSKIKAYDYRAWDKLDVDKMLDEIDHEEAPNPYYSNSEETTLLSHYTGDGDSETRALEEKDKGNGHFKKGNYKEAIDSYTVSIELNPNLCVSYVNRAMCNLKLNRFDMVIDDCSKALAMEPKNVKALWRRGLARDFIGQFEDSLKDIEDASILEPTNSAIKADLERISVKMGKKKPLRIRLEIEEIGDPLLFNVTEEKKSFVDERKDKVHEKNHEKVQKNNDKVGDKVNETNNDKAGDKVDEIVKAVEKVENNSFPVESLMAASLTIPQSFFEFERDWRTLKHIKPIQLSLKNQFEYLKRCQSEECLSKVLCHQLPTDLFSSVLDLIDADCGGGNEATTFLSIFESIAVVKRLDTVLMFLSGSDKARLGKFFESMRLVISEERLDSLCKTYKLTR